MPLVSILIPAFNVEKFISATIESVINQTFDDWEAIILDDCSTDYTYSIAEIFAKRDSRIKVFRNEKNLGMMQNWNKGIDLCTSEYFIKLDSDDLWHPQMLQESIKILKEYQEVALVFTKYVNIDENGNKVTDSEIQLPDFAKNKAFSCVPLVQMGSDKMLQYPILRQGLSVMRRNVFKEIGKYRYLLTPETQASTDTEFYFRVGCHYQIYCIDKTFYYYRTHKDSISATDTALDLAQKKIYEVKYVITDYFYQQNKLTKKIWSRSINRTQFYYNTYLTYKERKNKHYLKFFFLLLQNICSQPAFTFQFYFNRLLNK